VRQVLLLRATAAAGRGHDDGRGAPADDAPRDESTAALTAALAARGIRVVEAACESASGAGADAVFAAQAAAHGAFDRVVLRVDDGAAWPGDALDADWLERLGGCWAALARLPADAPHVLAIGAAPAPGEPDEPVMQPRWPAVLACADKERAGPSITWLERSPDADDATLAAHLDALLAIREPACRLTRDGLMVPRLARATPAPSAAFRARDAHAYLVSGGLGGVGARVLAWLLEQGARHVVSLNRRAPDAAEAALLDRLGRRHGARIDALATGVADPAALRDALQRTLGATPLAGVFHCAAVLDDRPFAREAWGPARDVLLPKGAGAWHLHRATLGQPLDHFVVFSSLSALLGQPGQAAYALANALAEAVVEHRRALGLPALAIQWGPWAGVGMAARGGDALAAQHRAIGLAARGADDYLRVLADWLAPSASAAPAACVGVFDLDWRRHAATYAPAPLWAGLVADGAGAGAGAGAGTAAAEPPSFAERLAEVPPDRRRHALRARLRELVAACVGCDAASIADTDGFAGIGVDSLHATVLHRQLEREFGTSLPATVAFDYPTVAAVADCLARGALGALFAPAGAPAVVPAPASAPPAARAPAAADAPLTDHSAAELARILERELDGLESRGAL
ncbi:beta-ketoacyl reductase, partial [Burkholderia ubonensis]